MSLPPSSNHPSPPPNTPLPSRGSSIMLWIGIGLLLLTFAFSIYADVVNLTLASLIITSFGGLLTIPLSLLQVNPHFFHWAQQTFRSVGLSVLIVLFLLASLSLNAYLLTLLLHHQPSPKGTPTAVSKTPSPTVVPPTPSTLPPSPSPLLIKDAQGQANETLQTSSSTTVITASFPFPTTAGNLIIVAITQWEGTVTSVSDTPAGDTYIPVSTIPRANPSNDYAELYYANKVRGGVKNVTVHFSTAGDPNNPNDMNVGIYEYAGFSRALDPEDHVVSNAGYGNHPDGGPLHVTAGNDLVFVIGVDDDGNNVAARAGSGYLLMPEHQDDSQYERFYVETQITGSGPVETDFALAAASNWAVLAVAFTTA